MTYGVYITCARIADRYPTYGGIAQVMGERRIEPPALLRLTPQFLIGAQQFPAHHLKCRADLPQLIRRDLGHGKVEVMPADPLRGSFFLLSVFCLAAALLLTYGVYITCARIADRYPTSSQSQPAHGNDQRREDLNTAQQFAGTLLLRCR